MSSWLTPPQIARDRGIKTSKVLCWIRSGELLAVNLAEGRLGRPRWKVSVEALSAFDLARSSRAAIQPTQKRSRPRRRADPEVIEFF